MPFFPSGLDGAGLLLLRLSVAWSALSASSIENDPLWQQLAGAAATFAIVSGFHARLFATLWLLFAAGSMTGSMTTLIGALPSLLSVSALAVLGPGAFSIDALRFGRRTVILPQSRENSSR